jgi:2-polyprenyl-3-methyl-5-hydroxy-6-metoxy-1,4-benzoquinol methylase
MPISHCRVCNAALRQPPLLRQLDMPASAQGLPSAQELEQDQPLTLELCQCSACDLVQLNSEPVSYYRDVIRAAGVSAEMRAFRLEQFGTWLRRYGLSNAKVLEVGCGRGEYLSLLVEAGANAHGIEHMAASVAAAQAAGLSVTQDFLASPSQTLSEGPFAGFAILNFLEHLPQAHQVLRGIAHNLVEGGIGLVEVPNFDMIVRKGLFAEFIGDHLFYFTESTLTRLLASNGFEVLSCEATWHDYVLSATVRKRPALDLSELNNCQQRVQSALHAFIDGFSPGRVAVWGAGHQALALISLSGIASRLRYVVDSAPFKQGRFTPATHLPIVPPEELAKGEVEAVIVLAASYSDEVVRTLLARHGQRFSIAVLRDQRLERVAHTPTGGGHE